MVGMEMEMGLMKDDGDTSAARRENFIVVTSGLRRPCVFGPWRLPPLAQRVSMSFHKTSCRWYEDILVICRSYNTSVVLELFHVRLFEKYC